MSIYKVELTEQGMLNYFWNKESNDIEFLNNLEYYMRDRIISLQDMLIDEDYESYIPFYTSKGKTIEEIEANMRKEISDCYDMTILADNLLDKA